MEAIKEDGEDILVDIEVSASSSNFEISGYNPWRKRVEVKVKAPPKGGKANKEVIKEISNLLKVDVEIVNGFKSRYKTLKIEKIRKEDFLKILKEMIK